MREPRSLKEILLRFAPGLPSLAAILFCAPIIFSSGFPAYQHDWSWPFTRDAAWHGFLGQLSSWNESGLGSPNPQVSANPLVYALTLFPAVVDPIVAGKIAFLLAMLCVAYGAYAAAASLTTSPAARCVSSLSYLCSPILVNKVGAGHIGYWWAYGLTAFVFALTMRYCRKPSLANAAAVALVSALSTIQIQFAVFTPLVVFCAWLMSGAPARTLVLLFTMTLGAIALVVAPTATSLRIAQSYAIAEYPAPKLEWQRAMGTPFPDILWLTHYPVPYADRAIPKWHVVWTVAGIAGTLAVAATLFARSRRGSGCIVLFIIGIIAAGGTEGPFGALWIHAYEYVRGATAFRENAHAYVFIALAYALAIARLRETTRAWWYAASVITLFSALPFLAGGMERVAPNRVPPPSAGTTESTVVPGRFAALPALAPLTLHEMHPGGIDVFAPGSNTDLSLSEYPALPPLAAFTLTSCACEAAFIHTMEAAGVDKVVARVGFASEDAAHQHVPSTFHAQKLTYIGARVARFSQRATHFSFDPSRWRPIEQTQLSAPEGPYPGTLGPHVVEQLRERADAPDDPTRAWVSATRWFGIPWHFRSPIEEGVVTQSRAPYAFVAERDVELLHANDEPLDVRGPGRTLVLPASARLRWDRIPSGPVEVRARGGTVYLARAARGSNELKADHLAPRTIVAYARPAPWLVTLRTTEAAGQSLLVFRDRFSTGWVVRGGRVEWHGLADGFGNAFLLTGSETDLTIEYIPQRQLWPWMIGAWATYLVLIALVSASYLKLLRSERDNAPSQS